MYVCVCNCFRDSELRAAVNAGAASAAEVFEALGHQPQCGGCLEFAQDLIDDLLAERMKQAS
jgi:bacterioferritin-associated ferredoxin